MCPLYAIISIEDLLSMSEIIEEDKLTLLQRYFVRIPYEVTRVPSQKCTVVSNPLNVSVRASAGHIWSALANQIPCIRRSYYVTFKGLDTTVTVESPGGPLWEGFRDDPRINRGERPFLPKNASFEVGLQACCSVEQAISALYVVR